MKSETGTAVAEVKDFSNGSDGSQTVEVKYDFTFDVLETQEELKEKFSPQQLLDMANARLKGSANSTARAKAVGPYAEDPNSPAALQREFIRSYAKMKKITEKEAAEILADRISA